MADLVTVCIPTYNGASHLEECLASIATQRWPQMEVVVADDGSTDGTVELAESWYGRLGALRVVRNPSRLGPAGNLNRCIELARGTWVKPIGQDDSLEPGGLERLMAATLDGVSVVIGARRYLYEGTTPDHRAGYEEALANALVSRFPAGGLVMGDQVSAALVDFVADGRTHLNFLGEPVAVLLRRAAVTEALGFDVGFRQFWDLELCLRLSVGSGVAVVPDVVGTFRAHQASMTVANLGGARYHLDNLEPLRLQLAYAFGEQYQPVRVLAAHRSPPLSLAGVAAETAWTAWRVAARMPDPVARGEALAAWRATMRRFPRVAVPLAGVGIRQGGRLVVDTARGRRRLRAGPSAPR